ncbi:hypothetical protein SBBP1_40019 [Burkholderiales bacterium]|nr:hypothetical protein SBBP1_40019 [Burkholderiales bacterium]
MGPPVKGGLREVFSSQDEGGNVRAAFREDGVQGLGHHEVEGMNRSRRFGTMPMESTWWTSSHRLRALPCRGVSRRSSSRRCRLTPAVSRCCGCGSARGGASRFLTSTRPRHIPGVLPCRAGRHRSYLRDRQFPARIEAVDEPTQMVDLVFGVRGNRMPSDYRFALWSALRRALPWFDQGYRGYPADPNRRADRPAGAAREADLASALEPGRRGPGARRQSGRFRTRGD